MYVRYGRYDRRLNRLEGGRREEVGDWLLLVKLKLNLVNDRAIAIFVELNLKIRY